MFNNIIKQMYFVNRCKRRFYHPIEVSKNKITKNSADYSIPYCSNCIYFKDDPLDNTIKPYNSGKCTRLLIIDLETTKARYEYAVISRDDHHKCGIKGNLYKRDPYL